MSRAMSVLGRLEASLRSAAGRNRRTLSVPGFELFLADTDAYLLNLAVPVGNPEDWDAAIAGMTATFQQEGRRPRLEFVAELHPELSEGLGCWGYRLELRAPVMVLEPGNLAAPSALFARYLRLSPAKPELLESFLRRQAVAYGGSEADEPVFLPGLRAGLYDGSVWAAGLLEGGGFVSGASLMLGGDAAELAGVWTYPEHQQRGLAFAVCARLLWEYFAAGHELAWLSAAEGAVRLYEKLGFRALGTQLNYGLPGGCVLFWVGR